MSTFNLAGHTFEVPTRTLFMGTNDQRVGIVFMGAAGPLNANDGASVVSYAPGIDAADLSGVALGHVPLLIDHCWSFHDLVGVVEAAWFEDGAGHAVVRFGHSPEAERILRHIADALPVAFSMGVTILDSIELPSPAPDRRHIRATRWRLREISVTLRPADTAARVIGRGDTAVAMYERHCVRSAEVSRAFGLDTLRARDWQAWAAVQGAELAGRFNVADPTFAEALDDAVAAQLDKLVTDMTGPVPLAEAA